MATPMMIIGQLAQRTGLTPRAIRYYERLGLIRPPARTLSNYRVFDMVAEERLRFVANCRALGFSIEEIQDLLRIMDDPHHTCAQVATLTRHHLEMVDAKLCELVEARNTLAHYLARCSGKEVPDCPMLGDLTTRGDAPDSQVGLHR